MNAVASKITARIELENNKTKHRPALSNIERLQR